MAQTWFLARNPGLWIWTTVAGVLMWRSNRSMAAVQGMEGAEGVR